LRSNNCLLLDEPTNHLDLATREAMVEALVQWPGTLVFVSHDRLFTRALAGRILAVGGGRVVDWPGSYDEYLAIAGDGDAPGLAHLQDFDARRRQTEAPKAAPAKKDVKPAAAPAAAAPAAASKPIDKDLQKEMRRKKNRLEELEARLTKIDALLAELDTKMAAPGFFDDRDISSKALAEREKLVKEQEAAWSEVEMLEA
jgi:ATP-binding cassette subfamily F protein 3